MSSYNKVVFNYLDADVFPFVSGSCGSHLPFHPNNSTKPLANRTWARFRQHFDIKINEWAPARKRSGIETVAL
uniref:Uncharacterized protein n=1 Tax=Anguilla anguilla TaxID=7936 RepID=A0A0E9Q187_ANGAN